MDPEERASEVVDQWLSTVSSQRKGSYVYLQELFAATITADRQDRLPIPGATLTPQWLEEIRASDTKSKWFDKIPGHEMSLAERHRADLLAHVDFLEALLRDALGHGEIEQYLAGRRAGLEEAARVVESGYIEDVKGCAAFIRILKEP